MGNHGIRYGLVAIGIIIGCWAPPAAAQDADNNLGLGGQIGEPSGITMKIYDPEEMSYDFLAAFDWDDFFYLNVHGLFERQIDEEEELHLFYGPGGFIGIRDNAQDRDDDIALGVSGRVGINLYIEEFELYAQVTPRIEIIPSTTGDVGGGLGFRYYF